MVRRVGDDWFGSPRAEAEPPPAPVTTRPIEPPAVLWVPIRCPICSSKECPVTASPKPNAPGLRYHRCSDCGATFKSLERAPIRVAT